jgi:glutathione S-transferase
MKLYGTPPSHFTRKVRVLLKELGIPFEFISFRDLMAVGSDHFANNPLHKFPILEDQGARYIESDLICEYLLMRYGRGLPLTLLPDEGDPFVHRQRLAIMNGGMAAGVTILRARRSGVKDLENFAFFRQEEASLRESLAWINEDFGQREAYGNYGRLSLLDITLICFVEWAVFREFLPNLNDYPNLARFAAKLKDRPSFAETHPSIENPA